MCDSFTQLHCSLLELVLFLYSVAGTPTGVTATRTGYDCVSISWTAPSTGTPPAGYEVFYQLTGVNTTIVSGGNTSNTELTLTGLTEVNYSTAFFVVSYGAEGDPVLPSNRSETATIAVTGNLVY